MGKTLGDKAPKIFHVNWFRKDDDGKFMWPGFGDNMRVLLWILDRCAGKVDADEVAIGYVPKAEDINIDGLENYGKAMTTEDVKALLSIDKNEWIKDIEDPETGIKQYFAPFGDMLPKEMADELAKLEANLNK